MQDSDAHPEIHAALIEIYRERAAKASEPDRDYYLRLADYHEAKAADPFCALIIPEKYSK